MTRERPWLDEATALEGSAVRLAPLGPAHLDALALALSDPALWRWLPARVRDRAGMARFIAQAAAEREAGTSLPFAVLERAGGAVVGTTRFMSADAASRRLEIGGTIVAPAWQRTRVNTEAKYLLLRHAFETLGAMRVELKTNAANAASRAAILRLGAVEEATLRRHMRNEDGSRRDSVYFSIVDDEWPAVRARLEAMLARGDPGSARA